jgi:two-component system, cell cycle sensor histidine kinase and response regulator CckA
VVEARGTNSAEQFNKVSNPRGNALQLAMISLCTLVVVTLYEAAKTALFPHLSLWASHLATIALSTALATAVGYLVLRRLGHREEMYRRSIEASPDAVWVHRRGVIVLANSACAALFGAASPDSLLGRNVLDFIHPEDRDTVRARIENRDRISSPVRRYQLRYIRSDRLEMRLEAVICTILYNGEPAALVTYRDPTDQIEAERKLRESEATLAAAQRMAHLGSWMSDLGPHEDIDKNPIRWSDEIYRILGYEVGQIEASRPNFLRRVHPDDRDRIQTAVAKAIRDQSGFSIEYRVIRPDGDERNVQGHVSILRDETTNKPLRIMGTIQDITDRKQADDKLSQFASIVESSEDAISSVGLDGRILSWNKGAERVYGFSAEEAVGQPISILGSGRIAREISILFEQMRQGERVDSYETVRYRKGGQPIDVSLTIWPVRDRQGKVISTAAVARDISARKQEAERTRRLAQLVDSATELISTGDREGRITFMNPAFLRAIGYSEPEVIGKYFRDVVLSRNNSPELREEIRANVIAGRGWKGECLHCRRDGSDFPVYLNVAPLKDSAGRVIGNVGIVRDLTESKQAEEMFYKAFHLNPEPITLATLAEGRYVDVNESFLRITGYKREEVIGRTSMEVRFWEKPEDRSRFIDALRQQGSVRDLEITFRTRSGERRIALDSADVIEVNGEKCVIAILRDVTERKSLESQLRQLQKMEAVGQLSGGIAHDFNNILSVILGYSEILETGLERNSKLRKTAQEITKAGQRAASLTRQLLAFSRQQVLEPKVLNLNTVVSDTKKMLRRLIGEHIAMNSKLAADLGPVIADRVQIEQVIMNLAVNARDAMPNGGKLLIETRNLDLDEEYCLHHPPTTPGKYVEMVMSDTGEGMDAQTLSHIFEPFFTTKEVGKGTGLGLATVYGVVKQSGGYIWVYSEPGLGTTFKVYLPRVTETVSKSEAIKTSAPMHGSETILLVEDEESLRTLTRTMLEQSGYAVLQAASGLEAIEVARNHAGPIDLLLTDIVMPGINGRELARNLTQVRPGIKVVYMSGYSGFTNRGLDAKEDVLISKPFTRDTLLGKLRDVLHLQKSPVA